MLEKINGLVIKEIIPTSTSDYKGVTSWNYSANQDTLLAFCKFLQIYICISDHLIILSRISRN